METCTESLNPQPSRPSENVESASLLRPYGRRKGHADCTNYSIICLLTLLTPNQPTIPSSNPPCLHLSACPFFHLSSSLLFSSPLLSQDCSPHCMDSAEWNRRQLARPHDVLASLKFSKEAGNLLHTLRRGDSCRPGAEAAPACECPRPHTPHDKTPERDSQTNLAKPVGPGAAVVKQHGGEGPVWASDSHRSHPGSD
jgi:hypothetical protein